MTTVDDPAPGTRGSPMPGWPLISLMLLAPLVGIRKRWPTVLHAVESDGLPIKTWPNGTAKSVCGLSGLRLVAGPVMPALWPPRLKGMPEGRTRCPVCFALSSKKRPRSTWKAAA